MDTTNTAPDSTLPDYLKSDLAEGISASIEDGVADLIELQHGASSYLTGLLNEGISEGDALALLEEKGDMALGILNNIEVLIVGRFEESGIVESTRKAINTFCIAPTEANLSKVAEVSKPMTGYRIPMDNLTRARFWKYAAPGIKRKEIDYGSVHMIASGHYDASKLAREAV